jgi:excisionase family DNA binding protein
MQIEPQFFSLAEVARILGYEKSTIYDRCKNGRIRTVRIDGGPRISREELLRYIGEAKPAVREAE